MSSHLARLAVRATRPSSGGLRPRVPARFEQPAGQPSGEPGLALQPVEAAEERPSGAVPASWGWTVAGLHSLPPAPGRGEDRDPAVTGALRVPGDERVDDAASSELPARADTAGAPAAQVPAAHPISPAFARLSPSPPAPSSSPASPSPRSPRRGPTDTEQVVASLVAEAVSAGSVPTADRQPHRPPDDDGPARPRGAAPVPAPAAPPTPSAPLTRLPAPLLMPPARRDRSPASPAAPAVTVTIGRIEVVPPPAVAPEPADRRARQPSRASGAPPLVEYLRGRSRR